MRKFLLLLFLYIYSTSIACGQMYRITKITPGPYIVIGTQQLQKYGTFDADSIIHWDSPSQALKVQDIGSPSNWANISQIQFRELSKIDISINTYLRMLGTRSNDDLLLAWADEDFVINVNLQEDEQYLIHYDDEKEMYPVEYHTGSLIIPKDILANHIGVHTIEIISKKLLWKLQSIHLQTVL